MLNRDQTELIHREIDGANTPAERAAFESLIEENSEAKALEADLRYVSRLFDRVGEAEPPRHLKQAILDALPRNARPPRGWRALGDHWNAVLDGFRKRPRFALVSSFCAGLAVGFGAYAALAGTVLTDRSNTSGLTGAFFEPRAADEWETLNEVTIAIDGGSGRASVKAGQGVLLVELDLDVERTLEVRLTFDEGAYGLRGFSRLGGEAGPYVTAEPGRIRVTTSGATRHTVVLSPEGRVSPLVLALFDGGEEVFVTTLLPRRQDRGG